MPARYNFQIIIKWQWISEMWYYIGIAVLQAAHFSIHSVHETDSKKGRYG